MLMLMMMLMYEEANVDWVEVSTDIDLLTLTSRNSRFFLRFDLFSFFFFEAELEKCFIINIMENDIMMPRIYLHTRKFQRSHIRRYFLFFRNKVHVLYTWSNSNLGCTTDRLSRDLCFVQNQLLVMSVKEVYSTVTNKLCGRPPQYAPAPCKLTFDLLTVKRRGLPLCQF